MRHFLGIDPDTTNIGYGIIDALGNVVSCGQIEAPHGKVEHRVAALCCLYLLRPPYDSDLDIAACAVEGQRRIPKSKVDPQDLIHLGQVAGGCLTAVAHHFPKAVKLFPFPSDWKGTIRKDIFTRRILRRLDLSSDRKSQKLFQEGRTISAAYPLGKHTHIIDAIGLADWARRKTVGIL